MFNGCRIRDSLSGLTNNDPSTLNRGLAFGKPTKLDIVGGWENLQYGSTNPRWIWSDKKVTNDITWAGNCLQRFLYISTTEIAARFVQLYEIFSIVQIVLKSPTFASNKVSTGTSLEVTTRRIDHTCIVIDYAWCICIFVFVSAYTGR